MQNLVPDLLWTDFHPMRMAGLPVGRRMALARGANGQIVVFSPLPISEQHVSELRSLGEPAAFVIPSRFHENHFEGYFDRFPNSVFFAGKASLGDHPKWKLAELSHARPELTGFDVVKVEGMPMVQEHVFFHRVTRTLIIADLLFNIPDMGGWFAPILLKMAGMGGKPGPSRLWRALIKNPAEFASSLARIRDLDFDRIIPGHGGIIGADTKAVFDDAFSPWLKRG